MVRHSAGRHSGLRPRHYQFFPQPDGHFTGGAGFHFHLFYFVSRYRRFGVCVSRLGPVDSAAVLFTFSCRMEFQYLRPRFPVQLAVSVSGCDVYHDGVRFRLLA